MNDPGRVALVTAGGTGIGAALARRIGSAGKVVAIVERRRRAADLVVADIERGGGRALAAVAVADLAELAVPADVVACTTAVFERLDVLVNNAAVIKNLPLDELTAATFDQHLAVNIRAPFLLLQAALPWLKASPAAAVVNISSSSAPACRSPARRPTA